MKKILITGTNGYVGNAIENRLLEESGSYLVDKIDLRSSSWKSVELGDYVCVIHAAGIAHQKKNTAPQESLYYEVNRDLALEVATKAKEDGAKQFVFLSSMSVYGKETGLIDEQTIEHPNTPYGRSKIEAEKQIITLEDNNFKIAILRPPMVYGKGCKGNYPRLSRFTKKYKMFPNIQNQRSMIYIKNLTECIKLIIDFELSGLFFPQNEDYVQTKKLVQAIGQMNNLNVRIIPNIFGVFSIAARISSVFAKVTGTLVYDKKLSMLISEDGLELDYNIVDFISSIKETECE